MKTTILGAGLSGISASYHLGHENCIIFERNHYPGGHIHSEILNGFTWDEGPHVSFTKSEYVRNLFDWNVAGEVLEYPVATTNYYKGQWIPHPAQSNLWAVPQPLRDRCLKDFMESRLRGNAEPNDYEEWLTMAFGKTFAQNFPEAYTLKYWTTRPKNLTTDWVGNRVFYPKIEDVQNGFIEELPKQTHYIKKIRYPKSGGYFSFARKLYQNAQIEYNKEVKKIQLKEKKIYFNDGTSSKFDKLINTLPLPEFVKMCYEASPNVIEAAEELACSSLLLVNVVANHPTARKENWIYVYDENKYATRINCTELLSPNNAPKNTSGIQVEVYFSKYKAKLESDEAIATKVCEELIEMGLVKNSESIKSYHTKWVPWANVIFDHNRKVAQNTILRFLTKYGLQREDDDLDPMTSWDNKRKVKLSELNLAGRFGQWKYYWTDDCVLRGKIFEL